MIRLVVRAKVLKALRSSSALTLKTAFRERYSPFIPCREENENQKWLADLLAEICRRPKALTVWSRIRYFFSKTLNTFNFSKIELTG